MLESALIPNLLYLVLVAGLWLAAFSIVSPGTGIYEGMAILLLVVAGLGTIVVPINGWALIPIALGLGLFAFAVWGKRPAAWLPAAAIVLAIGSAFLFETESGGPAVNLWLALVSSALTAGFFWLVARTSLDAHRAAPTHDPSSVLAKVGEVRTAIDPIGSVYVGGELWTATAESEIPPGRNVRIVGRQGLVLMVEPAAEPANEGKH